MAQPQHAKADVVPLPHEYGEPVKRWQRELEGLHGHYDSQKGLAEREFHAQRDKIRVSVLHRRQEQIAKLDADIHQYMHSVKLGIDSLLEELQTEKLHRLEASYKGQLVELEKMRDQDMLKHLKKYRSILGVSGEELSVDSQRPERSPLGAAAPREADHGHKGKGVDAPVQRYTPNHQFRALPPPMSTVDHRAEAARAPIGHRPQALPLPPILSSNYQPGPSNPALGHPVVHNGIYGPPPPMSQMKRRMDDQGSPERHDTRKRQRISMGLGGEEHAADSTTSNNVPRRSSGGTAPVPGEIPPYPEQKYITFDDVYQDGTPEYKHIIVEYPVESNKWYILRCDEHHVHFGLKPLLGAAKHLHSTQHSNLPKHHSLAVGLLGIMVQNCDAEKVAKNNAMVAKAFENGYTPFNVNRLTRTEKINQGFSLPETASEKKQAQAHTPLMSVKEPIPVSPPIASIALAPKIPKVFNGTTNPKPGQLYVGFWSKTKQKYAVMVFPFWGGIAETPLRSAKQAAGIGNIGLVANAPRCIRVSRTTQQVIGWAKDYEDDGPLVMKREFPVVYFDRKYQIGWLACRNIKPFNFDDPHHEQIHEYQHARNTYAELRGYKDFDEMKTDQPHGPPFLKREEIAAGALEGGKSPADFVLEITKTAYSAVQSPEHRDDHRNEDKEGENDKVPQLHAETLHNIVDGHDSEAELEDEHEVDGRHQDQQNLIDAQQLAARALQGALGGVDGPGATSAAASEASSEAASNKGVHRHTSLPRISTLHGILGAEQPSSASSLTSTSTTKSGTSPTEGGSITLPPRKALNATTSSGEVTGRHALPSGKSGHGVVVGPWTNGVESKPVITSPSVTSVDVQSRHSTPTNGAEGIDRWRAVRNASYSASPQPSFAILGAQKDDTAGVKKDARIAAYKSPVMTPGESIKANPLGEKPLVFDLAGFYGDSRRFTPDADEDTFLRLVVDMEKGVAETGADASMHLKIDPARIVSTKCSTINDTTSSVHLETADKQQQKLVFESNDASGRVVSANEQASKFCAWLQGKNGQIEVRPGSSSSSSKALSSPASLGSLDSDEVAATS